MENDIINFLVAELHFEFELAIGTRTTSRVLTKRSKHNVFIEAIVAFFSGWTLKSPGVFQYFDPIKAFGFSSRSSLSYCGSSPNDLNSFLEWIWIFDLWKGSKIAVG